MGMEKLLDLLIFNGFVYYYHTIKSLYNIYNIQIIACKVGGNSKKWET